MNDLVEKCTTEMVAYEEGYIADEEFLDGAQYLADIFAFVFKRPLSEHNEYHKPLDGGLGNHYLIVKYTYQAAHQWWKEQAGFNPENVRYGRLKTKYPRKSHRTLKFRIKWAKDKMDAFESNFGESHGYPL